MALTITATTGRPGVGGLLRNWRQRRRLSQLDLANEAAVSARHLSFVENGRSRPSRELVLHLAEHLDVPCRAQHAAAGRGLRPQLRPHPLGGRGDGPRARGARPHPGRPRAVPRRGGGPALATSCRPTRRRSAHDRRGRAPLLEPPVNALRVDPAPRGAGAPDRELRRVRHPPGRPAAPGAPPTATSGCRRCTTSCAPTRAWPARPRRRTPRPRCSCRWCCAPGRAS